MVLPRGRVPVHGKAAVARQALRIARPGGPPQHRCRRPEAGRGAYRGPGAARRRRSLGGAGRRWIRRRGGVERRGRRRIRRHGTRLVHGGVSPMRFEQRLGGWVGPTRGYDPGAGGRRIGSDRIGRCSGVRPGSRRRQPGTGAAGAPHGAGRGIVFPAMLQGEHAVWSLDAGRSVCSDTSGAAVTARARGGGASLQRACRAGSSRSYSFLTTA